MNTQNTLASIPTDLFHEIFSRLPIETIGICRCVSKILASRLGSEDFKQLFLTWSLTRPRLLFAVQRNRVEWVFCLSPQPQNPYEKSSPVTAEFHSEFPRLRLKKISSRFHPEFHNFIYVSGLFYFWDVSLCTTMGQETSHIICNPSTGQYVVLPKLRTDIIPTGFLGFDPIDKQFKLLVLNTRANRQNNDWVVFILTLGTGKLRWRTIRCHFLLDYSCICTNGICINGVLYYLTRQTGVHTGGSSYVIVCFDVRTETFEFKPIDIGVQYISPKLINYKGKLGITILKEEYSNKIIELYMLVLEGENVKKHERSKYTLPSSIELDSHIYVVGMTSTDDIVLSTRSKPFYLYYFNLEKKSLQSVEVQGFENHDSVHHVIMDHVEDLHVNDVKFFKSNIHAKPCQTARSSRYVQAAKSLSFTFEALCLSDEEDFDA